jgi:hypothetical protein
VAGLVTQPNFFTPSTSKRAITCIINRSELEKWRNPAKRCRGYFSSKEKNENFIEVVLK